MVVRSITIGSCCNPSHMVLAFPCCHIRCRPPFDFCTCTFLSNYDFIIHISLPMQIFYLCVLLAFPYELAVGTHYDHVKHVVVWMFWLLDDCQMPRNSGFTTLTLWKNIMKYWSKVTTWALTLRPTFYGFKVLLIVCFALHPLHIWRLECTYPSPSTLCLLPSFPPSSWHPFTLYMLAQPYGGGCGDDLMSLD